LQVLDNGRLTDGKGRTVNFRNTVIILTSNIGAEHIDKMEKIGFGLEDTREKQYEGAKANVEKALKQHFRPEFLNRLDDVVIFDILSQEAIEKIVNIQMEEVTKRLVNKNIEIKITPQVISYLAKEGYDPHYGARPIKRLIQEKILNPLAQLIIKKSVSDGGSVKIGIKGKEFVFDIKQGRKNNSILANEIKEEVTA
jgi:ATP-dependent Clp protease ATP-binding subunit ClpC